MTWLGYCIVADLPNTIGLIVDATAFSDIVTEAATLTWTRDPFDRLICATARAAGASLLSKDADKMEFMAVWEWCVIMCRCCARWKFTT